MIYGPNIILHGASEDSGQSPPPLGPQGICFEEFRSSLETVQ